METNFYKKSRRLKHCYKIVGKKAAVLPFIKNKAQEIVSEKIQEIRLKNKGKKMLQLLILKGRQLWITPASITLMKWWSKKISIRLS